ncbi:MAG: heavy-metal-associated domain-containing protein [Gemmatimonadaceae bacterium]
MERINISISGMTCGHCTGRVEKALKAMDGVLVENMTLKGATVSLDPDRVFLPAVVQAVAGAGYAVTSTNAA